MVPMALAGLAIAGYLSYEHATGGAAFCLTGGGGCAKVQNSPRLELLGIYIPYLAFGGYAGLTASLIARGQTARLVTAGLAYLGVAMPVLRPLPPGLRHRGVVPVVFDLDRADVGHRRAGELELRAR